MLRLVPAPEMEPSPDPGYFGEPYPAKRLTRYPWALDQGIDNTNALVVFLVLVHHDMPGGEGIFPTYDRLAAITCLRRQRVADALRYLEAHGWIERTRDHRGGRRRANRYRICSPFDEPKSAPRTLA